MTCKALLCALEVASATLEPKALPSYAERQLSLPSALSRSWQSPVPFFRCEIARCPKGYCFAYGGSPIAVARFSRVATVEGEVIAEVGVRILEDRKFLVLVKLSIHMVFILNHYIY